MFDLFKKKPRQDLPLPPPPSPPDMPPLLRGDIEPIQAPELPPQLPELSETPQPLNLPELPPELPEIEFKPKPVREMRVFDKTIPTEAMQPPARELVRAPVMKSFVAVEDYKKIINDTNIIRSKLMNAETFIRKLSDLKNEEERAFERWRTQLEDVEKKLTYVDQLITKAQS